MENHSYSSADSYRDLTKAAVQELDAQIRQHVETLLVADAAKHDKLVGIITGLRKAQIAISDIARKWSEDDEPSFRLVRMEDAR